MTTTETREAVSALIAVVKAVTVSGPDANGLLWLQFKAGANTAALSVQADSLVGKVVAQWRDDRLHAIMQTAASIAEQHDGVAG